MNLPPQCVPQTDGPRSQPLVLGRQPLNCRTRGSQLLVPEDVFGRDCVCALPLVYEFRREFVLGTREVLEYAAPTERDLAVHTAIVRRANRGGA